MRLCYGPSSAFPQDEELAFNGSYTNLISAERKDALAESTRNSPRAMNELVEWNCHLLNCVDDQMDWEDRGMS